MGSVEETPLAAACARGFKRIAEFLIQCGADINYKCSVSIATEIHVTSRFHLCSLFSIGHSSPHWVRHHMQTDAHCALPCESQ